MFDPTKPCNDLPLLPAEFDYEQPELLKQVNLANLSLAKINVLSSRLPNAMLLMSPLLLRESVASSEIEDIHTTLLEVLEAEVMPEKGPAGAEKEVLNYKSAMMAGFELVKKKGFLTTNDMLRVQSIIEPNKAGIRKLGVKLANPTTKQVFYTLPEGEETLRDLLANLEQFINNHEDGIDPLIKASVAHYQFESIHPFLDGNGRAGRILLILHLILANRLDWPILFLSGYILAHRSEYYRTLNQTNGSHDFLNIILFILRGIEEQSKATFETILSMEKLMQEYKEILMSKSSIYSYELVQSLFSVPVMTIDSLQKNLNLGSRQTSSKYLNTLVDLNILQERKAGKVKVFYSQKFLELIS